LTLDSGQRGDGERLSAAAGDHHSRGHAVGHVGTDGVVTAVATKRQGDADRAGPAGGFHQRSGPAAHRQQSGGRVGGQRSPQVGTPGTNGLGTVQQGSLETSNVNTVTELVNMIECQRAYEMNSKAITTTDQMLQYLTTNLS
jgi:flagellar basal-body rod protein FlgG